MPTPEEMAAGLERRTGRSIREWLAPVPDGSFTERVQHLVSAHARQLTCPIDDEIAKLHFPNPPCHGLANGGRILPPRAGIVTASLRIVKEKAPAA